MILIPTDTILPFFYQTTTLDGTAYVLEFRYNQREQVYYLRILLPDQTVLAQGIKIVSNYRLLQAYANAKMPPGEIVAMAQGVNDTPAALGELGNGQRVELVYYTRAEIEAIGADGWRV